VGPNFVTAVPGWTEISLDLRALDAKVLAKMLRDSRKAGAAAAKNNHVTVEWSPLMHIPPRLFDEQLLGFCRDAVREVSGAAPELPSGPLHDAAEMADVMPTVMVFAQSSPGISHCKEEDTPRLALDKSIRAFLLLVDRTVAHLAAGSKAATGLVRHVRGDPDAAEGRPASRRAGLK
jgi:acetylornithine deacetylase/succinyl-diaminopimelate desuccinylase-like protein